MMNEPQARHGRRFSFANRSRHGRSETMMSRRGAWSGLASVIAIALVAIVGASYFTMPVAAEADPGAVASLDITIASDGTPNFDELDGDANNGKVRINDRVTYSLTAAYTSPLGDVVFTSTLPEGMKWDASASSATVCNGPGQSGITNDSRTWTCSRSPENGNETFSLSAWVRRLGNGDTFAPEFTAGAVTAQAPVVEVVGKTQIDIALSTLPGAVEFGYTHNGVSGIRMRTDAIIGAIAPADGDWRGYEAPDPDNLSFVLDVPNQGVVVGVSARQPQLDGGTRSYSQPGGAGADATITIENSTADFNNRLLDLGSASNFYSISQTSVYIFVPYSQLPSGSTTPVFGGIHGFDPNGIGGDSNYGGGWAYHQNPSNLCPAAWDAHDGFQRDACFVLRIDRSKEYNVQHPQASVIRGPRQLLFGDPHGYVQDQEYVVPGQHFEIVEQVFNTANATKAQNNPRGCVVLGANLQLDGDARVGYRDAISISGGLYMWTGTDITDAPGVTVEYTNRAFADDTARGAYWCYPATPGSETWVSDPTTLPGGAESVTAVRYRVTTSTSGYALRPGTFVGVKVPVLRKLSTVTWTAGSLPWWFTAQGDQTSSSPRYGSYRTRIGMNTAMVRNTVEWADAETSPGLLRDLTIQPYVYGPVGTPGSTPSTTAQNTKITVNLGSTCLSPLASSLAALGVSYEYTPPNKGADNEICTADDGAAGKIVFTLGNLTAPAGAAGGVFHPWFGGHETARPPITFQVRYDTKVQTGVTAVPVSSTISSTSDTTETSLSAYSTGGEVDGPTNSPSLFDKINSDSIALTGTNSFTVTKEALTAVPNYVDAGEEFDYQIEWQNPTTDSNGQGTFVDVLPFDGDGRGTSGLGGQALEVTDVEADTGSAVSGDVTIEYTTDDPADVLTALQLTDNEAGETGISWSPMPGTVPNDITALRFRTVQPVESGYSGTATITVKAPELSVGGALVNNVYGRAEANGAVPAKRVIGQANSELGSSVGTLSGTVYRDLDYSGTVTTADDEWQAGTDTVELMDGSTLVASADVDASGHYEFPLVSPGDYTLRLNPAESDGWVRTLPAATIHREIADTDDVDLLYREDVAEPALVDDTAATNPGQTVVVDVTANDTLDFPTLGTKTSADGVSLDSAAQYGTASYIPGTGGAQGKIGYSASSAWPTAFALQTSYTDSFDYSWTNAEGESDTATVTVTVRKPTGLVSDTATIPDESSDIDVLANDVGDGLTLTDASKTAGDATVSVVADQLRVDPSHTWAGTETSHTVVADYEATDSSSAVSNQTATITVQRAPQASGGQATVLHGETATFDADLLTYGSITNAQVTTAPSAGSPSASTAGVVSFDAPNTSGVYTFEVTFTDNLDQTTTAEYTVRVQSAEIAAAADTARIPDVLESSIDVLGNDAGDDIEIASASLGAGQAGFATVSVASDQQSLLVTPTQTWSGIETTRTLTVNYTIEDRFGETATAVATITVQRPPQVTDQMKSVGLNSTTTFDGSLRTGGTIDNVTVTNVPTEGLATPNTSHTIDYLSGATPGTYPFEVTFTDDLGQTAVATFTARVQSEDFEVNDESVTIRDGGQQLVDVLGNDTGDSLTVSGVVSVSAGATAVPSVSGDSLAVTPAHTWATGEVSHVVTIVYTVKDMFGNTLDAVATVAIQRAPQATGGSQTVMYGETATFDADLQTSGIITGAAITVPPAEGDPDAEPTGEVTYEAGTTSGDYSFTVTFTDNLGQIGSATYHVRVMAEALDAVNDTQSVPDVADSPVDVLANDSGDTIEIANASVVSGDADVDVSTAKDELLVTPQHSWNGTETSHTVTVSYTIEDRFGGTESAVATVTVQRPPQVSDDSATVGVNSSVTLDGEVLTAGTIDTAARTSAVPIYGTVTPHTGGTIDYTSGANYGQDTFTVRFTDNFGQYADGTYIVNVQDQDLDANDDSMTIKESGPSDLDVLSNDTGDGLKISDIGSPSGGATAEIVDSGETLRVTPGSHTWGANELSYEVEVEYEAEDVHGNTESATATFTVQRAPRVSDDSAITAPGTIALMDADPITGGSIDTAQVTTPPASGLPGVTAASGAVTFDATGVAPGTYTFEVTFTDNVGQTAVGTYEVKVRNEALAPVADTAEIPDAATSVDVLDNDHGDALTVSNPTVVSGDATVTVVANEIRVTPTHAWAGSELTHVVTVNYTASDAIDDEQSGTATVTVFRAPQVSGGSTIIGVGQTATFDANPLSGRDIDTAVVTTSPAEGTPSAERNGEVRYFASSTPGIYTFSVTFTDDLGQATVADYSVVVQSTPVAVDDQVTLPVGGSHIFPTTVTSTGTIESAEVVGSADPLDVSIDPSSYEVSVETDGAPAGVYTFQVKFTDNVGQEATSTFEVTIQAPPALADAAATIPVDGSHTFTVPITTNGTIEDALVSGPAAAQVSMTGSGASRTLEFDGNGLAPGVYQFTLTAEDDLGQTTSAGFTVTIQAAPTAVGGSATLPMGGSHTFDANVTTSGGIDTAEILVDASLTGDFQASPSGQVTFTAAPETPAGPFNFDVRFTDDLGQSVTVTFNITMQAVPTGTGESVTVPDDRESASFDVLPRVTGVNLQPLTDANIVQPPHGTVTVNAAGDGVTFTAARGFKGSMPFQITVFDDLGQSVTLDYEVTVAKIYVAPKPDGGLSQTGASGMLPWMAGGIGLLSLGGLIALLAVTRRRREIENH